MSVVDPAAFGEQLELAEEAVRTERRRLADELEALTDFRECVRDAEPHREAALNAAAVRPVSTASAGESLEEIRDAYASRSALLSIARTSTTGMSRMHRTLRRPLTRR